MRRVKHWLIIIEIDNEPWVGAHNQSDGCELLLGPFRSRGDARDWIARNLAAEADSRFGRIA
jgi:hypothetical protein